MKTLVRLGLLVGVITMITFATVNPTHAATPDCDTLWFQTCPTEGATSYCQSAGCNYVCKCRMTSFPTSGLRWRCGLDPNYGTCT